ncbi:conserved hypothetical protein [Ricinus communis]|uniref:Reverse transcriptase domain-containing protein n=1 Tax=Ricinus communis TaxID=3988 RepID=B9T0S7_RICCO|nr:conserved hypothetical protein [Ricinus communis]
MALLHFLSSPQGVLGRGDSLSPYLFILASNALSLALMENEKLGAINGLKEYEEASRQKGRSKTKLFSFLVDKVNRGAQAWRAKHLCYREKDVLIKLVLQAILSYIARCFKVPLTICKEMSTTSARFWWGQREGSKGFIMLNGQNLADRSFMVGWALGTLSPLMRRC